jgi:hypothetical protein
MLKNIFLNKRRLSSLLVLILLVLSLIYFFPLLTPSKMMYGSDWLLSGYTYQASVTEYMKAHWRLPMWDSYNFSGHPLMSSGGGGAIVYPPYLLYFIFPVHFSWTLLFVLHIFLAGLGIFLLLREYGISKFASFLGAVIFMFSGQLITTTHAGHLGRMIGAVFLPYSFLFLHKAFVTKKIKDFIIFGGLTGLFLLAGHTQICYWGMIGVLSYFVFELFNRRKELGKKDITRIGGFFFAGIIVLILVVLIKLLPPALSLSYGARGVTRGYQYSTSWSMPTSELINLIAPHFSGILNNYWGENFFKLDSRYLGILPLMLLGFAFFYKKERRVVRYFACFTVFSLILALGKNSPLFRIYYYLVPMAKKFRGPSMFFFLVSFGVSVLAGFGAEALLEIRKSKNQEDKRKPILYLYTILGFILFVALIVMIGDSSILGWMKSHFVSVWSGLLTRYNIQQKIYLMQQNFPNFKKSLWISLLFFVVNGVLILAFLKKKINSQIVFPGLALLLLIDIWSIDKKYLSSVSRPEEYYAADDVTKFVKSKKNLFRVFPFNYEGRSQDSYFQFHEIENVGGYGPNPPGRYQEFIGAGVSVMFNPEHLVRYPYLLSMLNVKYIIGPRLPEDLSGYDDRVKRIIHEYKDFYSNFELAFMGREYQVLENRDFLPRFSLIHDYSVADSAGEALNKILLPGFEPGDIVFLEEEPEISLSKNTGELNIIENVLNEKILNVKTGKSAFLIVRENYHPDWKCYVDGKKEEIYRANYIFYGVFIPEGEHEVRFVFESRVFNIACLLSLMGFLTFLIALFFCFKDRRNSL